MYIHSYNAAWKTAFQEERAKINELFSFDIDLHHIGSTAVPGLSSKNCIDILGIIEDAKLGVKLVEPIQRLGYVYKGEYGIKGRYYFSRDSIPKVHLHVCVDGHEQIHRHLHFVEVMKYRPELVEELNQLKSSLSEQFSKDVYQAKKKFFYNKIKQIVL